MSYHSWQLVWGSAIFFLAYTLVVFAVKETALTREKAKDGKTQIRRNCFVIKKLYGFNFLNKNKNKIYPSNLGTFFLGMFCCLLPAGIFGFCFVVFWFFLGFVCDDKVGLKPYQRCGENNDEYFIAPWKWALVIGFMYLVCYKTELAKVAGSQAIDITAMIVVTVLSIVVVVLFIVCVGVFVYCLEVIGKKILRFLPIVKTFIIEQKTKNHFVAFIRSVLKATKDKIPPVEIVDED